MLRTLTSALIAIAMAGCAASPHPPLLHDTIRVTQTRQVDEAETSEPRAALKAVSPDSGDIFAGTDRRDPKTSVATGGLKSFLVRCRSTRLVS